MAKLPTFGELLRRWPSDKDLAQDLKTTPEHARGMRRNSAVKPRYWPGLIMGARRRKIPGVTNSLLQQIADKNTRRPGKPRQPGRPAARA